MLREISKLKLASIMLCALLCSCADDLDVVHNGDGYTITLNYTVDNINDREGRPASRAADDPDWPNIQSVHMIFFDAATDKWVATVESSEAVNDGQLSLSGVNLEPDRQYKTLIIANAAKFVPPGYESYTEYIGEAGDYTTVRNKLMVYGSPTAQLYPLIGEWVNGAGREATFSFEAGGEVRGAIRFRRSVCRLDIINEIPAANLRDVKIQVCNTRRNSSVFREVMLPDESVNIYELTNVFSPEVKDETKWISIPSDGGELKGAFYIFPTSSNAPAAGDYATTCIMVKGYYGSDTNPSYYRMNLNNHGKVQSLNPNRFYRVYITNVADRGLPNLDDAWAKEEPIQINVVECTRELPDGLVQIEGFEASSGMTKDNNPNGTTHHPLKLSVQLADPVGTDIYVQSDFDTNVDAYLSTNINDRRTIAPLANMTNASSKPCIKVDVNTPFYLHVYRTGPGDQTFRGNITVYTYINGGKPSGNSPTGYVAKKIIPVEITTNCEISDPLLKLERFVERDISYWFKGEDYDEVKARADATNTKFWSKTDQLVKAGKASLLSSWYYLDHIQETKAVVIADRPQFSLPRYSGGVFRPAYNYNAYMNVRLGGNSTSDANWRNNNLTPLPTHCPHGCHFNRNVASWMNNTTWRNDAQDELWYQSSSDWSKWHWDLPEFKEIGSGTFTSSSASTALALLGPNNSSPTNTSYKRVKTCLDNNIVVSKNRAFILSDFKKLKKDTEADYTYFGCYLSFHEAYNDLFFWCSREDVAPYSGWGKWTGYPIEWPTRATDSSLPYKYQKPFTPMVTYDPNATGVRYDRQCDDISTQSGYPVFWSNYIYGRTNSSYNFRAFHIQHGFTYTNKKPVGGVNMGHKFLAYFPELGGFVLNKIADGLIYQLSWQVGSPRPWRPISSTEWATVNQNNKYIPR